MPDTLRVLGIDACVGVGDSENGRPILCQLLLTPAFGVFIDVLDDAWIFLEWMLLGEAGEVGLYLMPLVRDDDMMPWMALLLPGVVT